MAAWEYDNFDLLIETEGDDGSYRARVIEAPTGESPTGTFRLPFEPTRLENLMLKLDPGRAGTRRVAADPQSEAALELGGGLFEALFTSDIRLAWARSIDKVRDARRGLRLRLRLTEAPALAGLPWELLYDRRQNSFIAQSERTPLIRYLEVADTPPPLDVDGPLRILVVVASPTDLPELDVDDEWNRIRAALADRVSQGTVQLDRLEQPTLQALSTWIRRQDVHVLHFVGYGEYDRKLKDGVLHFCDKYGRSAPVSSGVLGPYLRDHDPLRLIVLNACQSAHTDAADPFTGMAQALAQQDCVAVVTMQFPISAGAAAGFAGEFIGALADGLAVDQSVSSGRKALLASYATEWATPVLFLRDPDGRVFDHIVSIAEQLSSPAGNAEVLLPVAGAAATGAADTGAADTGAADTGAADTGAADTGAADTGAAATGAAATAAAPPGEAPLEPTPPDDEPAADQTEVLAAMRVLPTSASTTAVPTASTGLAVSTPPPDTVKLPTGTAPQPGRMAGRIVALVLVVGLLGSWGWWFTQRANDDGGSTSPPPTTTAQTSTSDAPEVVSQQVTVAGDKAWTDTGVTCQPGKTLQAVASGTVFHAPTEGVGPDGSTNAALRQFNLPGLRDANHSALVASLDTKPPYTVIGSSATYTCAAAGELFLGPNDGGLDNNHGQWTVTLTPAS